MTLHAAWLATSLDIIGNMGLAMLLGWVVGYERFYSGRAAGSQVYCLVSATSAAVTLLAGYPALWYGGQRADTSGGDPTRVIGAILTGIGFLGAGLIVQNGLNVRGLTTAASLWGVAALGILVGVGLYLPALGLTALFVIAVEVLPRVESRLPASAAFTCTLKFREGHRPRTEAVLAFLATHGLRMPTETMTLCFREQRFEMEGQIFADRAGRSASMSDIALELSTLADVDSFALTRSSRA
ncbi:MgtC/SapB family protein [Pelomonas cellulosilytica]|uniref:Protein MgtC n=1 Tax=Pelomonas cellulosilytica TaxID=2906762 RepID=A0ABS8XTA4_9BURK|nr:MgtC/SapB family protein [Pelomonas sp. P8]MCE4553904.1 MgtC/SapB family protein [Pelomonas sp. P8]